MTYPRAATHGFPSTEWFNLAVTKEVALAPTPGTVNAAAMAEYGAINIPQTGRCESIHLHQIVDGNSGTTSLEVYRRRSGAMTKVATISLENGGGDFGFATFSWVSEALRTFVRGDYLYLQATAKMGGSPIGFVDVHFDKTTL